MKIVHGLDNYSVPVEKDTVPDKACLNGKRGRFELGVIQKIADRAERTQIRYIYFKRSGFRLFDPVKLGYVPKDSG